MIDLEVEVTSRARRVAVGDGPRPVFWSMSFVMCRAASLTDPHAMHLIAAHHN